MDLIVEDRRARGEAAAEKRKAEEEASFPPQGFLWKPQAKEHLNILLESTLVLPKSNAEEFPAHGNHHGQTAGVKIYFGYDLLSGTMVSHTLEQATTQDKIIGKELLVQVMPGYLVLRDTGYFIIDEFTAIEDLGAKWLTRVYP